MRIFEERGVWLVLHVGRTEADGLSKEQITVTQCSGSLQFFRGAQLGHFAFSTLPMCPRVDVTVPPMGWMALEGALFRDDDNRANTCLGVRFIFPHPMPIRGRRRRSWRTSAWGRRRGRGNGPFWGERDGVNAEWEEWGKQEAEWAGQGRSSPKCEKVRTTNNANAHFRLHNNNARVDGFSSGGK